MHEVVVMAVSAAVTAATMTFSITSQMFFLFKNLRSEAEFCLVPGRKAQSEAIETIKNTDTIQGLE